MKRTRRLFTRWAMLFPGFLFAAVLSAQSFWLDQPKKANVTLEYLHPDFKGADGNLRVFVAFLSMRWPVGQRTSLVAELPYSYYHYSYAADFGYDSYSYKETETSVGNPYVGLEMGNKKKTVFGELGMRVPAASRKKPTANMVGGLTDFNREEAFVDGWLPISAMLNLRENTPSGFAYRLRVGPIFWFHTGSEWRGDQLELWLSYSAQIGFETDRFLIRGSFAGRLLASESGLDFDERTIHQVAFSTAVRFGKLWPGVYVIQPLDKDIKDMVSSVLGLSLCIQLK